MRCCNGRPGLMKQVLEVFIVLIHETSVAVSQVIS
jgi:hypothetical protein